MDAVLAGIFRMSLDLLVELTTGVHYFAMLCGVVNAFEVPALPDGDKLPA